MKLGNLLALIVFIIGLIGVLSALSLNDDSTFGMVLVFGACTFPIAGAFFHRTRKPFTSKDWLLREIKFSNTSRVDNK